MSQPTAPTNGTAKAPAATAPPPVDGRLQDCVTVVTGAASGIGRAYAERLAAEGATLLLADLEPAVETQEHIETGGGTASTWTCDVSDEADVQTFADGVADRFDRVDVLVNNAGIYPHASLEETDVDFWRQMMAVNLDGTFLMSRAFAPMLRQSDRGRIINVASSEAWMVAGDATAYLASKMGVVGLTRALATELAEDDVTVNAIAPGLTGSDESSPETSVEQMMPFLFDALPNMQALKRPATAHDLVGVVAFLASEDARFLTGQTIVVDGGMIRL
jgi:NAD(P)-dependent dehydrogenase (short-subunit alcohol dehydrogenase family)